MAAVCVYCASGEGIDERYKQLAEDLGTALAAAGHSLVSGGSRLSMMGRVARAVRAGGGRTLGVIPRAMMTQEIPDDGADELVVVDTMRERKQIMDENSDAFIALPGGLGTFEELFEVWTSHYLGMHPKPVIVLDPDGFYDPLWAWLDTLVARGFVRQFALDALVRVGTVPDAIAAIGN